MTPRNNIAEYHLHKDEPYKRQFEIYDLKEYLSANGKHSTKPHSHSFYQVIWFFNAKGTHFVDFESYEIKRNSIFFIAKNQVHHFDSRSYCNGILIHFNELFLYEFESDIDIFFQYHVFNNLNSPFIQVSLTIAKEIKLFINLLQLELNNNHKFGHSSILSNVLKSFLIRVEREKRSEAKGVMPPSQDDSFKFLEFRKLLEQGYKNNTPVGEYAKGLNISTKSLNRLVKLSAGKTTSQMIQERVIIEAKRKLMYSNLLINEIAFDLGFEDPSYFVKFFRKLVKSTPSQFRISIA